MTYKRMLQAAMAAGLSAVIGLGLTSCSRDYTAAYVYTISNSTGNISGFGVDYQSGILTQVSGSPFSSGLTSVTTIIPAPSGKFLYLIGGSQDAKVVELARGTDGKLYSQNTYSLPGNGTYPTAAAVDSTGTFLYVTFKYQDGYTVGSPGPGGIAIFPIKSDNSLGTATYVPIGNNPVSIAVSKQTCGTAAAIPSNPSCTSANGAGNQDAFVYVVDQETPNNAMVLGFAQNTSTGALVPLAGTTCGGTPTACQGYRVGVTPSAVAVDPTGRFAYVTDQSSNEIYGFSIDTNGSGRLTAMLGSPYGTGLYPITITIDPGAKYLFTVNYNDATVSDFAINQSSGELSAVAGSAGFTTGAQPTCITIEPALGIYVYTSNYLQGSISAGKLNRNTGALTGVQDSPYDVSSLPACITSVANGPNAQQLNNP